jgi:hypothetical protein
MTGGMTSPARKKTRKQTGRCLSMSGMLRQGLSGHASHGKQHERASRKPRGRAAVDGNRLVAG